jgi:hypothetical protein
MIGIDMNERIKKLAEQAGIDFFNSTDPEYFGRVYCEGWLEQQQKFAELIVKECADRCLAMAYVNPGPHQYAATIKKHFGVEE